MLKTHQRRSFITSTLKDISINNGKTLQFDHCHEHLTSWHMSRDSVTYVKMCLQSLVTDTRRVFVIRIIMKVTERNARGGYHTPSPWASEG